MIRIVLIVCQLLLLQFLVLEVIAAECEADEVCKPLRECEREIKFFKQRKFHLLKVCGIGAGTNEICCLITSPGRAASDDDNAGRADPESTTIKPSTGSKENLINSKYCGKLTSARIIGGEIAELNQFPWLVLLEYKSKKNDDVTMFGCGGSLISKRYILTAAHCVNLGSNHGNMELFSVRLGEHRISTDKDCEDDGEEDCNPPVEDIPVEKTIEHEDYSNTMLSNDIALIRLSRDVELSKEKRHIKTICLPVDESQQIDNVDPMHQNLQIAGWGRTENGSSSDVLLTAKVPYVPQEFCIIEFDSVARLKQKVNILDTHMCAGGQLGVDTNKGDSGSALMGVAKLNNKDKYFQHGVTSFGLKSNATKTFPGVYTRVASYIPWILDKMFED